MKLGKDGRTLLFLIHFVPRIWFTGDPENGPQPDPEMYFMQLNDSMAAENTADVFKISKEFDNFIWIKFIDLKSDDV